MPKKIRQTSIATSISIFQPVVLYLANKACHIKVHIHGQILVTPHVLPAPLKPEHTVTETFTETLAGSQPKIEILIDYSLKWDQATLAELEKVFFVNPDF